MHGMDASERASERAQRLVGHFSPAYVYRLRKMLFYAWRHFLEFYGGDLYNLQNFSQVESSCDLMGPYMCNLPGVIIYLSCRFGKQRHRFKRPSVKTRCCQCVSYLQERAGSLGPGIPRCYLGFYP